MQNLKDRINLQNKNHLWSSQRRWSGGQGNEEAAQKGQTSSYKINTREVMYNAMNIANTAGPVHALSCMTVCGLQPARLLCPWKYSGKNTAGGCHFFLQGTFTTHRSNPGRLPWKSDSLPLSNQGSLTLLYQILKSCEEGKA